MSLPTKAIDRLFERLSATYGSDWTRQWASVPIGDVKTAWAHELAAYGSRLDAISWALDNLPDHCPNAIQFRNLCRTAPAPSVPILPLPKADPERVAAELAKLGAIRDKPVASSDGRDWARRILTKHRGGLPVNPTVLQMAKSAVQE